MIIEILSFDGCPNVETMMALIREGVGEPGLEAGLREASR